MARLSLPKPSSAEVLTLQHWGCSTVQAGPVVVWRTGVPSVCVFQLALSQVCGPAYCSGAFPCVAGMQDVMII